eukprot:1529902-Prymnesium_polylepis.2
MSGSGMFGGGAGGKMDCGAWVTATLLEQLTARTSATASDTPPAQPQSNVDDGSTAASNCEMVTVASRLVTAEDAMAIVLSSTSRAPASALELTAGAA